MTGPDDLAHGSGRDRLWVLGGPASGKTTVARDFAELTGADHIELDALQWMEHWEPRPPHELEAELLTRLQQPRWIVDGQYPDLVDRHAHRADWVLWLDPPLWVSWPRLLRRTFTRLCWQVEMWNGNKESVASVFGPRSILLCALQTRSTQREHGRRTLASSSGRGQTVSHLRRYDARSLAREITKARR